jgi:hypothetical protein
VKCLDTNIFGYEYLSRATQLPKPVHNGQYRRFRLYIRMVTSLATIIVRVYLHNAIILDVQADLSASSGVGNMELLSGRKCK